ncbi:uncharacterized protein LOC132717751 [Ruditapes philippinarum]|uniref:uncharacterized protein LOC132717751 n=1 Tax=Ruditapes philippinarum TaxID=129788 RepID=UPI00295BA479|nr:uncharacterized protein LOC132717751 [Ruditapes philippinarum]
MAIYFNGAYKCRMAAASLKLTAQYMKDLAQRKRTLMEEYKSKFSTTSIELSNSKAKTDHLAKTANIDRLFTECISGLEFPIKKDFKTEFHLLLSQGDYLQGIKKMFQECEEYGATNEEHNAVYLENQARRLRSLSEEFKKTGSLWGAASAIVGILFAPSTYGASLGAGLVSAGIGMALNGANECEMAAASLILNAQDMKELAQRKRKSNAEYESKCSTIELRNSNAEIDHLAKTYDGLASLEGLLTECLSEFERAIHITRDFENVVHRTVLQGDSFQLLKEVFQEHPEEHHDETHEQMQKLKFKWFLLEKMILINSDRHGITF